ncbi:hypothetical protein D3C79_821960 [compost metagenome]
MRLTRLDRARDPGRGPLQPAPLPNQTVGYANGSHFITPHHGRLRQASLPVSPETAVHGGFAYALFFRSTSSRASNTLLISSCSLSFITQYQTEGISCPVAADSGGTLAFIAIAEKFGVFTAMLTARDAQRGDKKMPIRLN